MEWFNVDAKGKKDLIWQNNLPFISCFGIKFINPTLAIVCTELCLSTVPMLDHWVSYPRQRKRNSRERWIIVAVRAEGKALSLGPTWPHQELEVIQGTPVLLELSDNTVLWHGERLITSHTVETHWFGLYELQVPTTFSTSVVFSQVSKEILIFTAY